MPRKKQIVVHFTADSLRHQRGQPMTAGPYGSIESAAAAVACRVDRRTGRNVKPQFDRSEMFGYPRAWEISCGETVIADALQLPDKSHRND